ncbi:MAG: SsgA family sporulation/cell division regulator [Nocardioides sp.]
MSAQPASGLVHQLFTLRLLAPGRPTDVEADFSYDAAEPYAVTITFHDEDVAVRPELARSSLARGITEPVGGGRISLWPSLTAEGRAVVVMSASSPDGDLVCEIRTNQLHRFLTRTFALVPVGTESDHLDLDAVVERLLTSDAQ